MKIVIYGAGQTGNLVASILREQSREILGIVDDDAATHGTQCHGLSVFGGRDWLLQHPEVDAVCVGVGTIAARKAVCEWLHEHALQTISAIHSSAVISAEVTLGQDLVIGANTTLYVNPVIGDGCFIGPGVTVSHDTAVGKYCLLSVASVVGARCSLADEVLVGSAATLMPPAFAVDARLNIGRGAIVGVGATVIRDVEAHTTVVGTPAKPIKPRLANSA